MVSLCRDSTYTEFFWFPNRGTEEGYWENCWIDDGNEEDAVDINESVADEYQVTEKMSGDQNNIPSDQKNPPADV